MLTLLSTNTFPPFNDEIVIKSDHPNRSFITRVAIANGMTTKFAIVTGPLPIKIPYADQSTVPPAPRITAAKDKSLVYPVRSARTACGKKAPPEASEAT